MVTGNLDTLHGAASQLHRASHGLPRGRLLAGDLLVVIGLPLLTWLLVAVLPGVNLTTALLLYLLANVVVAIVGGATASALGTVAATILIAVWVLPGDDSVSADLEKVALGGFVLTGLAVSGFVAINNRIQSHADRCDAEAQLLVRLIDQPASGDWVHVMLEEVQATYRLTSVALQRQTPAGTWSVIAAVGERVGWPDGSADLTEPVSSQMRLVGYGPATKARDHRLLTSYAKGLARAVESERLAEAMATSREHLVAGALRAALLTAIGHELRTPLAGVKAAVSSLRQDHVSWTPAQSAQLLATIEESADRLDGVIGNLVDMNRVRSSSGVVLEAVALYEVVDLAVACSPAGSVEVSVSDRLPFVIADRGLLERVLSNLVANAVRFSPAGEPVLVTATTEGSVVHLTVRDHGPGVTAEDQERMFEQFVQLVEHPDGLGLGLAICRAFTDAFGATLTPSDTPGGGLTMTVALPTAP